MSRSRGGGGRGRGGRVLQAQLTRSSLTLLSRFPSSAAPPSPGVPLGESLFPFLSLSLSPSRCFSPLHALRVSHSFSFSPASLFRASPFLLRCLCFFTFALSPSLTSCRPPPSCPWRVSATAAQQQHPSKRKDFDPRFVLLAFCRNFPDFVFRLRVENQGEREKERERKERERER